MNRKFIVGSLIIVAAACSRVEIALNWADTYTAAEVDHYFSTTSKQDKELKLDLQRDLMRVRKELFPKWADFLRRVDNELQKGIPSETVYLKLVNEGLDHFRSAEPYFTDTAVNFISSTTPKQLDHFEKVVREKNQEDQKKIQNREKVREESRKKYLRWTDLWIGSLTKEQNQLLDEHLNQHPFPLELQIKNKEYRLEKFHEARQSPEALKAVTRNFFEHNREFLEPTYQAALQDFQKELEKFGYQALKTLTEKQKKQIHENLQEKIGSLEKLSRI